MITCMQLTEFLEPGGSKHERLMAAQLQSRSVPCTLMTSMYQHRPAVSTMHRVVTAV